jgi:hypothetical protein
VAVVVAAHELHAQEEMVEPVVGQVVLPVQQDIRTMAMAVEAVHR